ncbi:MAG: hypothetical protein M3552_20625 [Planctomycetota bacterium]|nr:hypothetical protein [Planctomycetaceae bacterium]MDQ3333021.1 hypothetical protein [Planctomycetota bacterium]
MNAVVPRHSAEEFKEWGDRIYEDEIRPKLCPNDHGKFVAIDVEGRGYELSEKELDACLALRKRLPDAQIWLKRVGYATPYRLGWHGRSKPE